MTLSRLRAIVLVVVGAGIAGMIATTIATDNNNGWVISFGWLTALGALALLAASCLRPTVSLEDEVAAMRIEAIVGDLVADGADESRVRGLLGEAVRFGRARAGRD